MERAKRVAMAKKILELCNNGKAEYGEESWETDIGRFTDPVRFELEKTKLFHERPQLIALSADLPEPGNYYATEIAGRPILLVRGKDGVARAFLNACRHRGVQIAKGCGKAAGFSCPYHAWTYGLDGALISVPNRSAFEEKQLHGLVELPSAEKGGMILVHPQPDGQLDFDEFFGPMQDYLKDFKIESYELIHAYTTTAQINWKHAVDGGLEAYHTPFLHKNTFGRAFGNTPTMNALLHVPFGMHHALVGAAGDIMQLNNMPEEEWPDHCFFNSTNSIFPNTVVGGGFPLPILFFQRSEPGEKVGVCDYVFRLYGLKGSTPEQRAEQMEAVKLFMEVSQQEDMAVQENSQIMMEKGIVPTVVFGKREINLTRMHKEYDKLIGHDADKAVAEVHAKMKNYKGRMAAE
jgi:nitrite reductase/ring-hydroxylating ferredoxin subunit